MHFFSFAVVSAALAMAAPAVALPVNGTGLVTPNAIFGTGGNANGSYTGETRNGVEVGLRAKQRYPAANIFNYDGDKTYRFESTVLTTNPDDRSVFNFEWAVNVDPSGTSGKKISDFDYFLSFDVDAGFGVNYVTINPLNTPGYVDHQLGDNSTAESGGYKPTSAADLLANIPLYNVMQQSSNLGFGFSADPDLPGVYDFLFGAYEKGTTNVLASSEIRVIVDPITPVPGPAALPLLVGGLGVLGLLSRRRRAAA
jgi:hypothetical protein